MGDSLDAMSGHSWQVPMSLVGLNPENRLRQERRFIWFSWRDGMVNMIRRKLTIWMVAAALAGAFLTVAMLKRHEPAVPETPATAEQDARRPTDLTPAQIQEAPLRTRDVFIPPATDATGSSIVNE